MNPKTGGEGLGVSHAVRSPSAAETPVATVKHGGGVVYRQHGTLSLDLVIADPVSKSPLLLQVT